MTSNRLEMSQFLILVVTVGGLFFWNRSESRSDYRELSASTTAQIEAIRSDMKGFHDDIMAETRDFHGRLCAIEAGRNS
jgi:hypothetical protein